MKKTKKALSIAVLTILNIGLIAAFSNAVGGIINEATQSTLAENTEKVGLTDAFTNAMLDDDMIEAIASDGEDHTITIQVDDEDEVKFQVIADSNESGPRLFLNKFLGK